MKRIVISLVVIFSLVFVPLAHAIGVDCDDNASVSQDLSKNEKQDNSKVASAHHCCVSPMVDRTDAKHTVALFTVSANFSLPSQADLASITVGPLLEPPSHA